MDYEPTRFKLENSYYDKASADYAVAFIEQLCHTKGRWAGQKFKLMPWQEQIVRDLFGILKPDGKRQFNTAYVEISKKNGKEIALDTPVPTPDGFTTMGEIKVGDTVFSETGLPCHVVAKSPVDYEEQAYRITFKDGQMIEAGEHHQWFGEYTYGKKKPMILTTGELYRMPKERSSYRFRIKVADAIQCPESALPVEPYLMGYWLGNGNATEPMITIQTCDVEEVMENIRPYHEEGSRWKNVGDSIKIRIPDLSKILVKSFHDKRIPMEYMRSSKAQRLRLLQGLMDSDGCISSKKGQAIYTSAEKPLAEDVSSLLWSLGIKNAIETADSTQRNDWSKSSRECGRTLTGETIHYVKFTLFSDVRGCGLKRKQCRAVERNPGTRSHFRYIDSIEPIENRGMQCVQVDSPSHQYLIGRSFLPTHNSELAAAIALYLLFADGEPSAEVYGAAADRQQASIVFDVASRMVQMSPALSRRSKILTANKRINNYENNGYYQVLSAEVGCVVPETLIQMENGLVKPACEVNAGDRILAFDGITPVFDEVLSVREEDPADVLEIITAHNRTISVTENHPFWAMIPGRRMQDLTHEYDWREACELQENTRLALALGWPESEERGGHISVLEAWALGAWAGDGDCTKFRFINPDEPVIEKLDEFLREIGSSLKSTYSTRQKEEGKDLYQKPIEHLIMGKGKRRKSPGREWVRENFGQDSVAHTKKIPEAVWKGGPDVWAAFLAGYLDTDGMVSKETNGAKRAGIAASICSVSEDMIRGCQILLARLGINASTTAQYKVSVCGKPQLRRLWHFLCPYMVHEKKRQRLQAAANEPIYNLQRANESDKIAAIRYIGKKKTISFEMKHYQTHSTNGFITHNTKHGLNVSGLVLDEVHVQPNRKLYDVLTKGSGDAREQPLYFLITTAGTDTNSICYELHQKALDIIEGRKIDPTFYPVIYAADPDDDWTDPEVWKKANPSLGITITEEKMRAACESAKQNPAEENSFRQLRLDQWVKQSVRWMPMHKWDACAFPVDEDELEGRVCYGGLDLSQTTDITALVLVFPPRDDEEKYMVLPYFWIPEDNVPLRVNRDHVPYDVWEKEGYLMTTEGNVVHYAYIEDFIERLGERFNIREIAFDRWGAVQMTQNLADMGFTVVPFGQGYKDMSPPTKELMKLVLEEKIAHGGHPVLRWMMDNVYVRTDPAGNIKMDKEKSTEKIDGAVALVMALDRAIRCGAEPGDSIYNHRGILFL